MRRMRSLDRRNPNLWLGVSTGLMVAAIFSGLLLLTFLFGADETDLPSGIDLAEQIALYLSSGLVGGALGGLLLPLTQWRIGGAVVGTLAVAPYFLGQQWLSDADFGSGRATAVVILLLGGVAGAWLSGPDETEETAST